MTPRERAERALAALVEDGLARRDVKRFYAEEFLREIGDSHRFAQAERERLGEFLQSADLVKFAAQHPRPEDIDASIARAGDFLRSQATPAEAAA